MTAKRKPRSRASRPPVPERSARWLAQREHLLQSAQRAIHRDGPQISMDEIAAEAGITKPILYRHFGDRRGMARALRDSALGIVLGVGKEENALARQAVRDRVVALYPVVSDAGELRRIVVGFATGFLMFVGLNLNLYRFLRAEGVLDQMWDESRRPNVREPVADSMARSLQAIYGARGLDETTAQIWAHALRSMITGVIDWWTESHACDRFELERHFDLLTTSVVDGLGAALVKERGTAPRARPRRASPPRQARTPQHAAVARARRTKKR